MRKAIGKVILSDSMIGWFDNVNGIRLTLKNKEAEVYEGQNLTLINQAVRDGKIKFLKY